MKRLLGASVLAATTLLLTPLQATAEEIRIIRGTFSQVINTIRGRLTLEGTNGLKMEVNTIPDFDSAGGWYECENSGCLPGTLVDMGSGIRLPLLNGGIGQVTIHGQTYTFEHFGADTPRAVIIFDTGLIAVPEVTDTFTMTLFVPFTLSGSVQVPNRHEPDASDVFELYGSGVATVHLSRYAGVNGWVVGGVTYDLEPGGKRLGKSTRIVIGVPASR